MAVGALLCLALAAPAGAVPGASFLAPGLALPSGTIRFAADEIGRCVKCHGMPNFAVRDSATGPVRDLHVDAAAFASSAHGGLSCRACHPDVAAYPHEFPARRPRVSCGADCHATDKRGRPYDHAKQARELAASVHGRGKAATSPDSPTCPTCHGAGNAHAVAPVKRQMTVAGKMALCAGCHDDRAMMERAGVDPLAVASYRRSFHYKAIHFGATGTAVCQDCHTPHLVLAKDDSASTIAAANLPKTCGQDKCHPGARMSFAMSGANHLSVKIANTPILVIESWFYYIVLAATVGLLLIGVALDFQKHIGLGYLLRRANAVVSGILDASRRVLVGLWPHIRKILID